LAAPWRERHGDNLGLYGPERQRRIATQLTISKAAAFSWLAIAKQDGLVRPRAIVDRTNCA
jgi:hypothetical protein